MNYNNPDDYWLHGYDPYKGMSEDQCLKAGCLQALGFIGAGIVVLLLCLLMGSCTTTKYVPVIEHHTDTLLRYSSIRDSIYVHDSIHVREKGDTVTVERWHTRWRDRWHSDTIYVSRRDSVPVPYEVVKEIERKRTTSECVLIVVGLLSLVILIIKTAIKAKRFLP